MKKVITVETLSTTATLETEESGRCSIREVLNKSQCMEFLSAGTEKSGRRKVERWPLAEARLYQISRFKRSQE